MTDLKQYLSAKEVVSFLATKGIETTDDTVRNWITKGIRNEKTPGSRHRLTGVRIGGRLYVVREDLLRWVPLVQ